MIFFLVISFLGVHFACSLFTNSTRTWVLKERTILLSIKAINTWLGGGGGGQEGGGETVAGMQNFKKEKNYKY